MTVKRIDGASSDARARRRTMQLRAPPTRGSAPPDLSEDDFEGPLPTRGSTRAPSGPDERIDGGKLRARWTWDDAVRGPSRRGGSRMTREFSGQRQLTAGDGWLEKGANLLLSGPPGAGAPLSLPPFGCTGQRDLPHLLSYEYAP